jgi:hypothetical protein
MLTGLTAVAVVAGVGVSSVFAGRNAPAAPAAAPITFTVHNAVAPGQFSTVSGTGQFVAYTAAPAVADGRLSSVWLRDQVADTATEITVTGAGVAPGESTTPVLSADGCSLVVTTQMAYDLFRDDNSGQRWDVYMLRLAHCGGDANDWVLVSEVAGNASNNVLRGSAPAVSGTAAVIAYTHQFSRDQPELSAISVADLSVLPGEPGRQVRLRGTPAADPEGNYTYAGLREPSISDDGTIVAFTSDATSERENPEWGVGPVEGGPATSHVFVWDRLVQNGIAVERVTPDTADGGSSNPSLSGAGHLVAFQSTATNIVDNTRFPTCDVQCQPQVFLASRLDNSIRLVSGLPATPSSPAVAGDGAALDPMINGDGATVVFVSRAQNLFDTSAGALGAANEGEVVAADLLRTENQLRRVSLQGDGVSPLRAVNARPAISGNGRVITFDSATTAIGADGVAVPAREVVAHREAARVTLASVDVGTVTVGILGPEWFQRLTNVGNTSFTPTELVSTNPEFTVANECQIGVPVLPGDSCRVRVTLTPKLEGPVAGTATIKDTTYLGGEVVMSMKGAGGMPHLAPATDADAGARWPETVVGAQSDVVKTFNVRNVGFEPAVISAITVTGQHAKDFSVTGGNCRGATVAVSGNCSIEVRFTPGASGVRVAQVQVKASDGTYTTVLVDGSGYFAPGAVTDVQEVGGGGAVVVTGLGYPPNTGVAISWADGGGLAAQAITDKAGVFQVTVPVSMTERSGDRALVAQAFTGEAVLLPVTVLPQQRVINAASPVFRRP